jgi:hypothetical protein
MELYLLTFNTYYEGNFGSGMNDYEVTVLTLNKMLC